MKKIDNKTKMIIGGIALLGLFFAYKKGLFGGGESEEEVVDYPADVPETDVQVVVNKPKFVIPKPTQSSMPVMDRPMPTSVNNGVIQTPAFAQPVAPTTFNPSPRASMLQKAITAQKNARSMNI
jgi:hypothetical protein